MLAASNSDNHVVRTALLDLNEWGLQADAEHYKCYSDARARIHNEMQLLEAEDAFYREELASIVHHMEVARVMDKLGHLQATEECEQVGCYRVDGA